MRVWLAAAARHVVGMLLLEMLLELVAAMLTVRAVRALILRLAAALESHVTDEILARVVATLALGALVALLALVLRARERAAALSLAREHAVARSAILPRQPHLGLVFHRRFLQRRRRLRLQSHGLGLRRGRSGGFYQWRHRLERRWLYSVLFHVEIPL